MRHRKKLIIVGSVAGAAIILSLGLLSLKAKPDKQVTEQAPRLQTFTSEEYNLQLSYPTTAEQTVLSEEDKKDKVFLRLQQTSRPPYLITARAETGLRAPSQIARTSVLSLVIEGALASLPGRYTGYNQVLEASTEINGQEAHQITFTYQGPSGAVAKQRLILIALDEDTGLYISMQASAADFDLLDEEVFTPLQQSLRF